MLRGLLFSALLLVSSPVLADSCSDSTLEVRHNGVQAQFSVELAVSASEQAQGLMHRESMGAFAGMLFVYDRPRSVSFWMKNTILPLDMLFIDGTGTVRRIVANATPFSTTPIPGGEGIQFVLEINGGTARMLGFSEGAQIRHPAISQKNAVWPCE